MNYEDVQKLSNAAKNKIGLLNGNFLKYFLQELRILRHLMVVGLLAEHVLFLQGITLAERLYHIGEHILKEHVLLRIGTKLLHGIDYLENNRRFPLG